MKNLWTFALFCGIALYPVRSHAAVLTVTIIEGNTFRLRDSAGNDINTITLGTVGLCESFVDTCSAATPPNMLLDNEMQNTRSDVALFATINNAAGARIGTSLAFCSDRLDADPHGDNNIPGCTERLTAQWALNEKFMREFPPVGGVEVTPYEPSDNTFPGFWPGNRATYNLVSDVPEPSAFALFGTGTVVVLLGYGLRRIGAGVVSTK